VYDRIDPNSPTIRIGRRPRRSEMRPQNGANTNCIAENEAIRIPFINGVAWYSSEYRGKSGSTIRTRSGR